MKDVIDTMDIIPSGKRRIYSKKNGYNCTYVHTSGSEGIYSNILTAISPLQIATQQLWEPILRNRG